MHYLIDLDNTLLDTYYIDENGKNRFYWAQDFEKDFNVSQNVLDDLFQGAFLIALYRTKMLSRFFVPFLMKYNIPLDASGFLNYWLSRDMRVNQSVWEWIQQEREQGHVFHIASNQPHVRMDYLLEHLPEWKDVFNHVFTSARLGVSKEEPEFFRYAQYTLKVPFNQMCLIDDSIENIKTAKSLGMHAILFKSVDQLDKEKPVI